MANSNNQTLNVVGGIFSNMNNRVKLDTHKDVITKLKFICQVKKGEKINTKYMYVQPDGVVTRISRTFINVDSRINTITFIKNTLSRSFDIIKLNMSSDKSSERQLALNLVQDLLKCKAGLNNLKLTYVEDTMFNCEMDTIIEEIDSKIIEYRENGGIAFSPLLSPDTPKSDCSSDINI